MNGKDLIVNVIETRTEVARVSWTTPKGVSDTYETTDIEEAKGMARFMSKPRRIAEGWKVSLKKGFQADHKRAPGQNDDLIDFEEENQAEMEAALGSEIEAYYAPEPVPSINYKVVEIVTIPLEGI